MAPGRPIAPALACAAPFAAGALLSPHAVESGPILCPFRALTGLPCPLCGSVRAFTLLMHGDGGWLQQNAVVVALVACAGLWFALRAAGVRMPRGPSSARLQLAAVLLVTAVAWGWTLSHAATIVPS